jgi:hypothetical protein
MRIKSLLLLTLCWAGLALPARADITYEYVTDATNYLVNPGQTVTVNLYLQETLAGTTPSLIAADKGIFGVGIFINQVGVSPTNAKPSAITAIAGNVGTAPNAFDGFATPTLYSNATTGAVTGASLVEGGSVSSTSPTGPSGTTTGGSVSGPVTRVFVGTMTLAAGDANGQTTYTLQTYKYAPAGNSGNTLTYTTAYNLDNPTAAGSPTIPSQFGTVTGADVFGANGGPAPFTFNVVVAVPEPGSMGLASLAAAGMAVGAWRRWRNRRKPRA